MWDFLTEMSACVMFVFLGCYGLPWRPLLSQAMIRGEKKKSN